MPAAYRVATDVPWDHDGSPDWGHPLDNVNQAVNEVMKRARKHRGAGFDMRERAESFGPVRTYKELDNHMAARLSADKFHFGDVLIVRSRDDNVRWLIREIQVQPVVIDIPEGNDGVDINHTLIFRENANRWPEAESWGILNKRYIGNSTTWSQHSPWREDGCKSNAEDFHHPSLDKTRDMMNEIIHNGRAAKILLAGSEWLPSGGWRYVGSYIDHYDHGHCEPLAQRHMVC